MWHFKHVAPSATKCGPQTFRFNLKIYNNVYKNVLVYSIIINGKNVIFKMFSDGFQLILNMCLLSVKIQILQ